MKVKATKRGFYGTKLYDPDKARKESDLEFELVDKERTDEEGNTVVIKASEQFSKSWMKKVEPDKPKRGRTQS